MPTLNDEQKLAEVQRIFRALPEMSDFFDYRSDDTMMWISDARSVLSLVHVSIDRELEILEDQIGTNKHRHYQNIRQKFMDIMTKLRRSTRPISASIEKGNVFDYYDETRKILELAKTEIFLIDSYVDAEIVSTYFKAVDQSVSIRVLTSAKKTALSIVPAAKLLQKQNEVSIEIRSNQFHDRFWIIDGTSGYLSSASVKDGGKNAAAVIMPVLDAFNAIQTTYEDLWDKGVIQAS